MPKRVLYICNGCGGYIYNDDTSKVRTADNGKIEHYHYDDGRDCLSDRQHQEQMELDLVAVRGEE